MKKTLAILSLLAATFACGRPSGTPESRAAELDRAALKMVRIEMQATAAGDSLVGEALRADSLFGALQKNAGGCVQAFVQSGEGECGQTVREFLDLAVKLPEPEAGEDAAAASQAVLQIAPEVKDSVRARLAGYAAALELNMDESLEIGSRLRLVEFIQALGGPVTYRDLGLVGADTLRLSELAGQMAARCKPAAYGTGEFDFFIAMRRLDDVGSRFGRQKTAEDLAVVVESGAGFDSLRQALSALRPMRIAFFGDSQTDNRHWSSPAHYPNIIAAVFAGLNPNVTVINAGIGGDDSGEGLARIQKDVLDEKPDICFILFGGNVCMFWGRDHSTVSPEKFRENIATTVTLLKAANCRPVLLSYPHIAILSDPEWETLQSMNAALAAVRDSLGAGWLDTGGLFDSRNPRRMFSPDGIHFSPEGHELLSRRILEYLTEIK